MILDDYLDFVEETESPKQFHRWAFISCCAAALGRNIYMTHGHRKVYPQMYVMLVGSPGVRKSSSINIPKKILAESGYANFSFTKSTKQKFLLDWNDGIYAGSMGKKTLSDILDTPIGGEVNEIFCAVDEFIDFIGVGNIDFISLLTTLWDSLPVYDERLKNSLSVSIACPTLNLLGGITPVSLAMALPAEASGQGFFSRVLLIYSEPSGRKIAFPPVPDELVRQKFVRFFAELQNLRGEITMTAEAREAITKIYDRWENNLDVKLEYYAGRRFDHLIKTCMVLCAIRKSLVMQEDDVIHANTLLCYTEQSMAKALSEFGTAKNLSATSKVYEVIANSAKPLNVGDIWKQVTSYFDKMNDLSQALNNLRQAGKILVLEATHEIIAAPTTPVNFGRYVNYELYIREYQKAGRHDTLEII